MRKVLFVGLILINALLYGQTWQTINNVNHVYDIEKAGNSIYFSSWGGVMEISGMENQNLAFYSEIRQISTGYGLLSNDIRNLAMIDVSPKACGWAPVTTESASSAMRAYKTSAPIWACPRLG
jgi:hypothetical protein